MSYENEKRLEKAVNELYARVAEIERVVAAMNTPAEPQPTTAQAVIEKHFGPFDT